jgi:hypothetical protein
MSQTENKVKKEKSPILAAILNIFLFLGYIYVGNVGRFIIFNIVYFGASIFGEVWFGVHGDTRTLMFAIIGIISMFDVYSLTKKYNQKLNQLQSP